MAYKVHQVDSFTKAIMDDWSLIEEGKQLFKEFQVVCRYTPWNANSMPVSKAIIELKRELHEHFVPSYMLRHGRWQDTRQPLPKFKLHKKQPRTNPKLYMKDTNQQVRENAIKWLAGGTCVPDALAATVKKARQLRTQYAPLFDDAVKTVESVRRHRSEITKLENAMRVTMMQYNRSPSTIPTTNA